MTHLAVTLFFMTIFAGAGMALQLMVRGSWREIERGFRAQRPCPRFTVTLRPLAKAALAPQRRAAAA